MLALEDVDDEDFIDNCEYLEDISDCDLEVFNNIENMCDKMLKNYSSVLLVKFNLMFPKSVIYPRDNLLFNEFIKRFTTNLRKHVNDISCFWIRTNDTDRHNHAYNVILMVNTFFIDDCHRIQMLAWKEWCSTLGLPYRTPGIIDFCEMHLDRNRIMLDATDINYKKKCEEVFEMTYYLSKYYCRDTPRGIDKYGWY